MIQHSEHEKQLIKAAKKAFKKNKQSEKPQKIDFQNKLNEQKTKFILSGIVEGEQVLEDDYPVYFDYLYVVYDDGGKVIRSNVQGTILTLKKDLQKLGYKAELVYNCNRLKRNLL